MSYDYAWEKFHVAVSCLAGAASQKARLYGAMISLHTLTSIPDAMPKEIKTDFDNLWQRMTSVKAESDEGTIQATIDKMTEEELSGCVEEIIGMYDRVTRHQEPFDEKSL